MYIVVYKIIPLGGWDVDTHVFPTKDDAKAFLELCGFGVTANTWDISSKVAEDGMTIMAAIKEVKVWKKEEQNE